MNRATALSGGRAVAKSEQHYPPITEIIMSNDFFKLRPIEWVDLPFSLSDRWGERKVSEAKVSSPLISIPLSIYERKKDGETWFCVSINIGSALGEFDTIKGAKIYAQQMLQANIASLIRPAYTSPEAKILHDTEQDND